MKLNCCTQALLLIFLLASHNQATSCQNSPLTAAAEAFAICDPTERCVRESYCEESRDAGHGIIQPRVARICGKDLTCCNLKQLESYNTRVAKNDNGQADNAKGQAEQPKGQAEQPKEQAENSNVQPEPSGYESCGVNMECVPRKLCRDNAIINDGRGIVGPRMGLTCTRALHRCCAVNQRVANSENPFLPKLASFKYPGCGHSNPQGLIPDRNDYNYTKDVSLFGQFPWMVALVTGRNKYLCGGTLIHPQLVLTTAHNIENQTVDTLVARMGEWDLSSMDEPYEHETRRIKQIIRHEEFDSEVYFNDIALLVLDEPLQLLPHIQPLCLPPSETPQVQAEIRDAQCFATGWGSRTLESNKHEQLLKRIDLPVISKNECQGQLRLTRLGVRFRLRPSFLCAGGIEGKDTCKGDGGSPLFCTLPGQAHRYQLAGLVSWGIQCAVEDVPAVYVNVPYLRSWINEQVERLSFVLETP